MQWVCLAILIIGSLISLYGGILFLIVAFRDSIFWGLACLLVPFVSLIYLVKNWEETRYPFFIQVIGAVILGGGMYWLSLH